MSIPGKGSGARELAVRVKTGKGRKLSSKLWLERKKAERLAEQRRANSAPPPVRYYRAGSAGPRRETRFTDIWR